MDNGLRTMPRASVVGKHRGLKPGKKRTASASHARWTVRVLCPLRTPATSVCSVVTRAGCKWRSHPSPTRGGGRAGHVRTLTSGVPWGTRRRGGRDGSLGCLGDGTWGTPPPRDLPGEDTQMPGCGRVGGGGRGATRQRVRRWPWCRPTRGGGPKRLSQAAQGVGGPRGARSDKRPHAVRRVPAQTSGLEPSPRKAWCGESRPPGLGGGKG